MSRRIVPGMFWAGILLCMGLLLADGVRTLGASDLVPNLLGNWDGFSRRADNGALGLVRSRITRQVHRRIVGGGVLLDPKGRVLTPYDLRATVAADNSINGTGRTPKGRVVYHADLETFAGDKGDAGVQFAQYHFVSARGGVSGVDAILLHPFSDSDAPDVSGIGVGSFSSQINPHFVGRLLVEISPRDQRGGFPGHVKFIPQSVGPGSLPPLSWDLRATTSGPNRFIMPSGANRFVMIAQGASGRLVADGVTVPNRGGGNSMLFIGGFYSLHLLDGRTDFGAYNFNVAGRTLISAP